MSFAPKRLPPAAPAARTITPTTERVVFGRPPANTGERVTIYGPGGIGKTSLAAAAPAPAFIDLDGSLGKLARVGAVAADVMVAPVTTWADLRSTLNAAEGWEGVKSIVIDTMTKAEELATQHVLDTIPAERDRKAERIEDYGYGKGYRHLYDEMLRLLSDLERHVAAGRNVILVAHDTRARVPNPAGEDWLRYEPLLYQGDKVSIRERVRNWSDHLLYVGYDIAVTDGRARGQGSRTIYTAELPTHLAKSRTLPPNPMVYRKGDTGLWAAMMGGEG